MGRILVIRGGAVGDFILTLPVLAALRSAFPQAAVDVLGYPHIAALAGTGGLADEVHAIEARPLAGFFARHGALDARQAAFFTRYAVIVSYLYDPDGIFADNVRRTGTRAQFLAGPHRPDERAGRHAADVLLEPLQKLAIFDPPRTPVLRLAAPPAETLPPGPWVALHPGSGSENKNWPLARWQALLARLLAETRLRVLLAGGEAEDAKLAVLSAGTDPARVRVSRAAPLTALAGLLSQCAAFAGHDSGLTHLAAALGLPCAVLWGPTPRPVWRPLGERIVVLSHDGGLHCLDEGSVLHALTGLLPRPDA
jgi:heptosyltransferase-2